MEQADILYFSDNTGKLAGPAGAYITARSALPPEQMVHALRSTVAEIDPLLALEQVQPMTEAIANVEAPRRFNTGLISAFALVSLLLALIGIYAVVGFSASLRTHEIAIRMALGAQRTRIAGLILSSATKLALLGCTLGVLGSLAVSRIIKSLLFEVSATDPLVYLAGVLIMMTTAILASALPARRVASLDPIVSLRSA
jgi:putative ABC transport system permease protein